MTTRPYAHAAADYWRAGWANPIPVRGKWPPPTGYTGYDGVNVSWPDLQAWLEGDEASLNIALRLPAGIVGIDVDAHGGKTGADSVARAEAELGPLPPTSRSTSRAPFEESSIRLYRVPTDVDLRGAEKRFRARFGDHVDIIRRDHRYAVIWPSIHPETGGTYQWYDADGRATGIPSPAALPELPHRWVEFLAAPFDQQKQSESNADPRSSTVGDSPWDLPRQFTREQAVEFVRPHFEALRSAPVGTINNRLNDAAFVLSHFVPTFWSRGEATRFLLDALADTEYDGRTWRAETTIDSGLNAKGWRAELTDEEPGPELSDDDAVRAAFPRLDWHALWADDSEEEWIIEPLLPARRLVALYSPPKVGKSLLMLELAVAVARGEQVLGTTPDRPRRVLYVDFENDPKGDVRARLRSMGYGPGDLENLSYLSFPTLAALDSPQGGKELMAVVAAYECELVVIDTVSRAIKGEENENDTWLAFYRHTGKALKAAGIALIRLDHTGKDETKGQRGGSAKSGDVDAVWRMSVVARDKTYRLDCEANRMPVLEKTLVIHRETSPRLLHRVDAAGRYAAWEIKIQEVIKALDAAGVPADAGRPAIRAALKVAGLTAPTDLLTEVVRRRKGIDSD